VLFLIVAGALVGLLGQQPAEFEVASIRHRPDQPERELNTGTRIEPGRIRLEYASLADCIALAYQLGGDRIVGPDWLAFTRFDIAATLPPGARRSQVPGMLQTLLAKRFGLRVHRETREVSGYQLTANATQLEVEASAPDADSTDQPITQTLNGSGAGIFVSLPRGASYTLDPKRFEFRKMTLAMVADALSLFVGRPVVDATGLAGHFNITLEPSPNMRILTVRYGASMGVPIPPEPLQAANDISGGAVAMSLRRAGLMLTPRRLPLEILVVDAIEKSPIEN
jgi:uncharacterized protein (TIGR03435 family)